MRGIYEGIEEEREIGRTGQGVIGIRLKEEGDEVVGITTCKRPTVLTITENGFGKRTHIDEYRVQGRGGTGVINIKTEGRNGEVIGIRTVEDEDEIERLSLAYSPKFQKILNLARQQIRDGSGIRHTDFWKEVDRENN